MYELFIFNLSMELSEKAREYLYDLILNDFLHGKDFGELTREGIEELKKHTLKVGISDEIGVKKYIFNMEKILKYQIETGGNDEIILKTCFHISVALSKIDEKYGLDLCILSFLQFGYLYGYDVLENDLDFFNPDKKNQKVNKDFSSFWYNIETFAPTNENGEKNYIEFYSNIFSKIGYEELNNLYKIQNKKIRYSTFSICRLLQKHKFDISTEQRKELFSPRNLDYVYHPIIASNLEVDEMKKKFDLFHKEYLKVTEYSNILCNFMFDTAWHKFLIERAKTKKEVLLILSDFEKKYKNISYNYKLKNIDEAEYELIQNQYLFMDLLRSRYNVQYILEKSSIEDLRELFYYFYKKIPKTSWFKYAKDHKSDNIFYRWYVIFELSRIFLHKQIKKEQFDQLHSLYEYSTKYPKVALFYNLTLGKFSFSFIRIGTEYFLQGYNLLLKQLFKNFWLCCYGDGLDEFKEIGKESSNAMGWYYEENDDDIAKLIFSEEGISHEFKASLCLDWRKKLQTGVSEKMTQLSIIKPIVAFLNGKVSGKIIVGIREGEKVKEEIEKGNYFKQQDLEKYGIKSYKKSNYHYLTGIDIENKELLGEKTDDNLKQRIDGQIENSVTPSPQVGGGVISLDIKNFLGKKILIVDIKPGNTVFCLKKETKKGKERTIENIVYVRKNGADIALKDPIDIIKLTESKRQSITLVTDKGEIIK